MLADAIAKNGKPAIDFEVAKRQIDAIGALASSDSAKRSSFRRTSPA